MSVRLLQQFLKQESAGGVMLFVASLLAIAWANSPIDFIYRQFSAASLFVINDGLMAIFFLLVGLELKREYLHGQLASFSQVLLPFFAAVGGMIVPAMVYFAMCHGDAIGVKGWTTPVATDIAFALGVLSLFGRRVPMALKMFLLALAIFDDLGAIVIIAVLYTRDISLFYLLLAAFLVAVLFLFNKYSVRHLAPYLVLGVCLWVCLLYAGIHPTIGGVALAFMIPADKSDTNSPLQTLETCLSPYVAYFILPLFALANAGFSLRGLPAGVLTDTVVWGIILGLFLGKQIGVFVSSWIMIRIIGVVMPRGATWLSLYGIALICGIGFTMSLFLGTLSFENESAIYLTKVRLGVMVGSILSGLVGAMVLRSSCVDK
jgi:NhaA family Na+:H+ antiporter